MLRRALSGACALPRGTRVLIAASGGADSTALLLGLHRVAPEFGLEVHAAHLHHGLRGAEADADARFVADLCAARAIPLESGRRDARALLRARGLSGQDGLRIVRREFLSAAARRAGCTAIATAHTADDQLETLLMRLGRGAGIRGVAGIAPRRGRWIRPLLAATRAEIEADLAAARVRWREDASNADRAYTRNRVRHDAVPALVSALGGALPASDPARARAGLARRVASLLSDLGELSRWLDARARRIVRTLALIEGPAVVLPVAPLRGLPRALRLAVLRRAWASVGRQGLRRSHLDALDRALTARTPRGPIRLPDGVVASARAGRLRFVAAPGTAASARDCAAGSRAAAPDPEARCRRGRSWGTVAPRRTR